MPTPRPTHGQLGDTTGFAFTNPFVISNGSTTSNVERFRGAIESFEMSRAEVGLSQEELAGLPPELLEQYLQEMTEVEKQRKLRQKEALMPVTLSIHEIKDNGRTVFSVRAARNGKVFDERHENNRERAMRSLRAMKSDYESNLAVAHYRNTESTTVKLDIRGERVGDVMRSRRNRVDRRGRRPVDDVVTEEGLVLSIPHEQESRALVDIPYVEEDMPINEVDEEISF